MDTVCHSALKQNETTLHRDMYCTTPKTYELMSMKIVNNSKYKAFPIKNEILC